MPLSMDAGLSSEDFVLDGEPVPLRDMGAKPPPHFFAHVYCGQTAGWIKMPLGMEVGLGLRHIVFDVDPATPRKKGTPTPTEFLAHVYCGQIGRWVKAPLGTEVDLGSGHIVLDWVSVPVKGAQHPPSFRPMCIVATVAHLSYC